MGLIVLALACSGAAWADTVIDPLHGQCNGTGTGTCSDNGTNTPLGNSTTYGFTISPGPQTGDLFIDILVPDNYIGVPTSFSFTNNESSSNVTATEQTGTWTSGDLYTFLGIKASPNNPIGAYLPSTQFLDPGATGFFVFQADVGSTFLPNTLTDASAVTGEFTLPAGFSSDQGAYILGFCGCGGANFVATANSGALLENGNTPVPTPEPSSLLMLGAGLLGVAMLAGLRTLTA